MPAAVARGAPTLRAGDAEAFAAVYEATAVRALSLARLICRCPDLAEDVVQQAYLDVWRSAARFDPSRGTTEAWVLGVVRNRSIDALRRRGASAPFSAADTELVSLPARSDTEREVANRLECAAVRQALGALPPEQRLVLVLAYTCGLSHGRIAAELGLPLGTIKSRMRLGLRRLREALADGVAPSAGSGVPSRVVSSSPSPSPSAPAAAPAPAGSAAAGGRRA